MPSGPSLLLDRYLASLDPGTLPLTPGPLARAAIGLMVAPAIVFTLMPALVGTLGSLALLSVPAVFALHAVGLWLIRQGRTPDAVRRAWRTWLIGLGLGVALAATTLAIGFPAGVTAGASWGSAASPGLAWLVVYPLVPTAVVGATVQATWAFADRRERLILSWSVVGAAFALALLLVLRVFAPAGVSGPIGILAALGVSAPVLLVGIGRLLWRTSARNRAAPSQGPISPIDGV